MTIVFGFVLGVQVPVGPVLLEGLLPPHAAAIIATMAAAAPYPASLDNVMPSIVNQRNQSRERAGSVDAVLREVVGQRPLADAHQFGGVFLDAAGALQRAADRLALDPLDVLPQFQR